ncbi:MAG: tetratricopeptide repeat protein [Paracoccaceae bacterium]
MLGAADKVSLFGRFRLQRRDDIARRIWDLGGQTVKDLTRATTLFVVGSGAQNLLPDGRLGRRLSEAKARGVPVIGEARLLSLLDGKEATVASLPIARVAVISDELTDVLNAFDLIHLQDDQVAFADSDTIKNAARLEARDMTPVEILTALRRRTSSPRGRHQLGADAHGQPVLEWEDGITNLSGQGMLRLDDSDTLDGLFEQGLEAELEGDLETAARIYETCALSDKRDPISPYNLGNVRAAQGRLADARIAFERAIARDENFAEAFFNLAGILETEGRSQEASERLRQAIKVDPNYPDPMFNLAQLAMQHEDITQAEDYFRRYLNLVGGEGELAKKARKALHLIDINKSA